MLRAALRTTCRPVITVNLRSRRRDYIKEFALQRSVHISAVLSEIKPSPKGTHEFPQANANFETSVAEWEFVERLIPPKYIPQPNYAPGTVTPSGWVAPSAKPGDHPYFVMRNANHLLRIYKNVDALSLSIKTNLKGIEGDIFALGKELQKHLLESSGRRHVKVRVHEPHGVLIVSGDYSDSIREFLVKKGF